MVIDKVKTAQDAKAPVEQVAKKQQEYHLIGKQRRTRGHILFEFDRETKQIRPAVIDRTAVLTIEGCVKYETKVNVKQNCFYIQALNVKNAEKKLRKIGLLRN